MTAGKFTVTEVKTFHLDHACLHSGCARVFTIRMTGTQAQAVATKNTPPPNVNGWRDGYCPEHAGPAQQASPTAPSKRT